MPDLKFSKPWHGIPLETIRWNPTGNVDACIGCGIFLKGCSRFVYRYEKVNHKTLLITLAPTTTEIAFVNLHHLQ